MSVARISQNIVLRYEKQVIQFWDAVGSDNKLRNFGRIVQFWEMGHHALAEVFAPSSH